MKISELGEFGLIERIAALIGSPKEDVLLGIGDDAALVAPNDEPRILTTDMLIEGAHFATKIPPHALGYKSLAVNISDIAAVAGSPKYALVSLGMPRETPVDFIDELYRGLIDCAGVYGVQIIGGDTTNAPVLVINVVVAGDGDASRLPRRSNAVVGDAILVTGSLGASAAGLFLIQQSAGDISLENPLVRAHLYPPARVFEAKVAAEQGCRAMEDISDGLGRELVNIGLASGIGAVIQVEKVPVAAAVTEAAAAYSFDPLDLAIAGGEDYELVFTAPLAEAENIAAIIFEKTGTPVTIIGGTVAGEGVRFLKSDGSEYHPKKIGYEHFE